MAKSKIKTPLIIILLLAVIAVAAWFFVGNATSKQAEQELNKFLVENNLEDKVTWAKLEASPTGKAKLHDVKIHDEEKELIFTAEEFNLNHYKETEELLEVGFDFKNLVDVKGDIFQAELNEMFEDIDMPTPQGIDIAWHTVLDTAAQKSSFKPSVVLPDFIKVDFELNADSPEAFINMAHELNKAMRTEDKEVDAFELLGMVNNIKISDFTLTLEDKGGMKPLKKSLMAQELPGESTPELDKQREEFWSNQLEEARQECLADQSLASVTENIEKACNTLMDFVDAKKDKLKIKTAVAKPLSVDELMMLALMMGSSSDEFLKEYQPSIVIE